MKEIQENDKNANKGAKKKKKTCDGHTVQAADEHRQLPEHPRLIRRALQNTIQHQVKNDGNYSFRVQTD